MIKPLYIPCDCHAPHHFLLIEAEEDIPDSLNVAFISERNGYFWQRVKWALKHVFGRDDLVLADVIVKKDDLRNVLN